MAATIPVQPDAPSFSAIAEEVRREHSADAERAVSDPGPETAVVSSQANEATPEPSPVVTGSPETSDDLISDAELTALHAKHPNDPAALAKELKGVFTKKTQALAEERKRWGRFERYEELLNSLETDARGTIAGLAKEVGYTVQPSDHTPLPQAAAPTLDADEVEFMRSELKDFGFMAEAVTPALAKLVERRMAQGMDAKLAPIQAALEGLQQRAGQQVFESTMKTFDSTHPDWKQFEPAMNALVQKFPPPATLDQLEYMDFLYKSVTRDRDIAEASKKMLSRMQDGARLAEGRRDGHAEAQIDTSAKKYTSIREAFADAKAELARR